MATDPLDLLNQAADKLNLHPTSLDSDAGAALVALFRRVAWMGRLDRDLLSRVGCDEVIEVARAVLAQGERTPDDAR